MKLGLIAGVHEDVVRLEQALALLKGKECDAIACLGDIVGYSVPFYGYLSSRDAHRAIQLVRRECNYIVAGNHDYFHARKIPKHTTFAYPKNWYELEMLKRKELSRDKIFVYEDELPAEIDANDREFLRSLPEYAVIENGNLRILASHYAYPNLTGDQVEFDPNDHGIQAHLEFMDDKGAQLGVFSHDLEKGIRFFTRTQVLSLSYGKHKLPPLPLAISGPWVASGTEPNGVTILDTKEQTIEVTPLSAKVR